MKGLDRQQIKERGQLAEAYRECAGEVRRRLVAIDREAVIAAFDALEALEARYQDLEEFRLSVSGEIENYIERRSDAWRDTASGEATLDWAAAWEPEVLIPSEVSDLRAALSTLGDALDGNELGLSDDVLGAYPDSRDEP